MASTSNQQTVNTSYKIGCLSQKPTNNIKHNNNTKSKQYLSSPKSARSSEVPELFNQQHCFSLSLRNKLLKDLLLHNLQLGAVVRDQSTQVSTTFNALWRCLGSHSTVKHHHLNSPLIDHHE